MQSLGRPVAGRQVPRQAHVRRDPAPTRWQYRMQRLWLTPVFRVLFRVGLPVASVGLVAALVLSQGHESVTDLVDALVDYPGDVHAVGDCLAPRTVGGC